MARPTKQGISYFSLNVDFLQDIKVRKIMRAHGSQSVSILISLLGNIYRDNGYYIRWDEDLPFLIADEVGVSEGAVNEVINKAVQVDFFEKTVFEKEKALTSRGIQKRFLEATRLRKEVQIDGKFWLIEVSNSINLVFNNINPVNNDESTQSKVNKTKLNIFSYENDDGKIEKIDYDKFLDFFNSETNGVFGKPKKPISETRKKHIRARLSEHKVAGFVNMLKKAVASSFLKGENKNGWSATLDWMINQSNFQKIIEGNYDNKSGGNSKSVNDIWEDQ